MDRSVLEGDPHVVLEAMAIAGYAIGASQGYIYVRAEYPIAVERLNAGLTQFRSHLTAPHVKGAAKLFDQRTGEKERVIVSLAHWRHSSFQISVQREHVQCGS